MSSNNYAWGRKRKRFQRERRAEENAGETIGWSVPNHRSCGWLGGLNGGPFYSRKVFVTSSARLPTSLGIYGCARKGSLFKWACGVNGGWLRSLCGAQGGRAGCLWFGECGAAPHPSLGAWRSFNVRGVGFAGGKAFLSPAHIIFLRSAWLWCRSPSTCASLFTRGVIPIEHCWEHVHRRVLFISLCRDLWGHSWDGSFIYQVMCACVRASLVLQVLLFFLQGFCCIRQEALFCRTILSRFIQK